VIPFLLESLSVQGQVPSDLSIFFENELFMWSLSNLTLVQCNKDTFTLYPRLSISVLGIFNKELCSGIIILLPPSVQSWRYPKHVSCSFLRIWW
jgi:hypothetical protein